VNCIGIEEGFMLEVTEPAQQQISKQLQNREVSAIRIFLNHCGNKPVLEMALDDSNDNDETFDIGNFKYVVDKELMKQEKKIKIDFVGKKIAITSSVGSWSATKSR